jgi:DNA-binding CsgD family transcriptional regulator
MQAPGLAVVFAIFLGIGNTIGMINVYYILGVVGKKYNSMQYLRLSILFIGICGGVSGVAVGNLINSINTFEISIVASVISAAVVILFLILSPVLAQTHYGNEWAEDSGKMEIDNEHLDLFRKYELSKREIEVCKLLLEGYTLRQISAILTIAYSTVNTYCTSLYRKLGINSRIELLILFKGYVMK